MRESAKSENQGLEEAILRFLSTKSEPVTESEIHKAVKGRKQSKLSALRNLLARNEIEKTGDGKRGNPFQYALPRPSHKSQPIAEAALPVQEPDSKNAPEPLKTNSDVACEHYSGEMIGLSEGDFQNVIELFQMLKKLKDRKDAA